MRRNMNKVEYLIFLVNPATVGDVLYLVGSGNDKSILLMLFYYPVLITVNGLMGYVVRKMNPKVAGCFYWATIFLIILFLPLLLISPWLTF
jgi:hypothetical protein